jgi:hypothetical protein
VNAPCNPLTRVALLNRALEFPEIVTPHWALSGPQDTKVDRRVPPVVMRGDDGKEFVWRNLLPAYTC